MNDIMKLQEAIAQPVEYTTEQVKGLISAMIHGDLIKFEWKGLELITTDGGRTLQVGHPTTKRCYGSMKVTGTPIKTVFDWLDRKARLYGDGNG